MATSSIVSEVEQDAAEALTEYVLQTTPAASGYFCRPCGGQMIVTTTPAGEPVIECPHCHWTVAAVETVISEVFATDGRLARIIKLMATTGCGYDLAGAVLADCCGGR